MPRKPSDKPKKPMGRPKIDVQTLLEFWSTLERMIHIQCTQDEIQDILRLDLETLSTKCEEHYGVTFSELYKTLSAQGRSSLRRHMWKKATNDEHPGMQIWLSKQHLNMKEKIEETFNGEPFIVKGFNGESVSMGIDQGRKRKDGEKK